LPYTWTELYDSIKVRGSIPTAAAFFTEGRLLTIANDTLRLDLMNLVNSVQEGFYSYDDDTTVDSSNNAYRIPSRAVGAKLENAILLIGTKRSPLTRFSEDEILDSEQSPESKPGFYIKRNHLYLLPKDGAGFTTLRQVIVMRPNQIVKNTEGAEITAIDTGTKVVTCSTVPAGWTTSKTFDIVKADPGFDWLAIDQTASAVTTGASGTLTFSALPSELAVGDWVSLAGESPVIQLPVELQPLLAQETANVAMHSKGDAQAMKLGTEAAKKLRKAAQDLINPRVEKAPKKIRNRSGILRVGL